MRNFGLVVAFVLGLIGLSATPSLAQSAADVPVCAGVELLSPADGAALDPDYRVRFTWSAEPRGTASRDWVSIRLEANDGKFSIAEGAHHAAQKGQYKAFARGQPGIYTWFVVFKDAKGNVICMSKTRTYVVGDYSSNVGAIGISSGAPAVSVKIVKGRYVIVLAGASGSNISYGGTAPINRTVNSDNYNDATDHDDWQAQGFVGLEIWGNNANNKITGSDLSDLIYGGDEACAAVAFAGCQAGDTINGKDGDDIIHGGNEGCASAFLAGCLAGDDINGGDGNDTVDGGNEGCLSAAGAVCGAGDAIKGGKGDDTINGGDEGCAAAAFVLCGAGDNIDAGQGKDTVNGGNEGCAVAFAAGCNAGDTISGGADDDTINGGNEGCLAALAGCNAGDAIHGNGGDDTINAGGGADSINGDAGQDTIDTGGNDGATDTGSGDGGVDTITNGPGDTVTQN